MTSGPSRTRTVAAVAALALSSAGCASSGQTGSPDCAGYEACVCGRLAGRVPMFVDVVAVGPETATLRVSEILSPLAPGGFRVGDVIVAATTSPSHCGSGAEPVVTAGERLFAAVEGTAPTCIDPPACDAGGSCGDGGACEALRDRALATPFVVALAAPTDPLDFGDGDVVPLSDVSRMTDPATCDRAHPVAPPPCNDTPGSWRCTAVASRWPARPSRWLLAVAALAATLAARRRRIR